MNRFLFSHRSLLFGQNCRETLCSNVILTMEMYLKYTKAAAAAAAETSPSKNSEVSSTHMQMMWHAEVCPQHKFHGTLSSLCNSMQNVT